MSFTINDADLIQAINGTATCAASMRSSMSTAEQQLALKGLYGSQKVAFTRAHDTAQQFGARLNKDLQRMEDLLTQAGQSYGHGDAEVADALLNLASHDPSGYATVSGGGAGPGGGAGLGI